MSYYDFDPRYEDEDDVLICPCCGASDSEDLDLADHAGDCPRNPYGYNHPDFLENCKDLIQDLDEEDDND